MASFFVVGGAKHVWRSQKTNIVYICIYVFRYICIYVYMYLGIYVHMCICKYVYIYIYILCTLYISGPCRVLRVHAKHPACKDLNH